MCAARHPAPARGYVPPPQSNQNFQRQNSGNSAVIGGIKPAVRPFSSISTPIRPVGPPPSFQPQSARFVAPPPPPRSASGPLLSSARPSPPPPPPSLSGPAPIGQIPGHAAPPTQVVHGGAGIPHHAVEMTAAAPQIVVQLQPFHTKERREERRGAEGNPSSNPTAPAPAIVSQQSEFEDIPSELLDIDFDAIRATGQSSSPPSEPSPPGVYRATSMDSVVSHQTGYVPLHRQSSGDNPSSEVVALRQALEMLQQQNQQLVGEKAWLRKMHNENQNKIRDLEESLVASEAETSGKIEEATKELSRKVTLLQSEIEFQKQSLDDKTQTARQLAQRLNKLQQQSLHAEKTKPPARDSALEKEVTELRERLLKKEQEWQEKLAALQQKHTSAVITDSPARLRSAGKTSASVGETVRSGLQESVSSLVSVQSGTSGTSATKIVRVITKMEELRLGQIIDTITARCKSNETIIEVLLSQHSFELLVLLGCEMPWSKKVGPLKSAPSEVPGLVTSLSLHNSAGEHHAVTGMAATKSITGRLQQRAGAQDGPPSTLIGFSTSESPQKSVDFDASSFPSKGPTLRTPLGAMREGVSGGHLGALPDSHVLLFSPGIIRQREALFGKGVRGPNIPLEGQASKDPALADVKLDSQKWMQCTKFLLADPLTCCLPQLFTEFEGVGDIEGAELLAAACQIPAPHVSSAMYTSFSKVILGIAPRSSLVATLLTAALPLDPSNVQSSTLQPSLLVSICAFRILLKLLVLDTSLCALLVPPDWVSAPVESGTRILSLGSLPASEIKRARIIAANFLFRRHPPSDSPASQASLQRFFGLLLSQMARSGTTDTVCLSSEPSLGEVLTGTFSHFLTLLKTRIFYHCCQHSFARRMGPPVRSVMRVSPAVFCSDALRQELAGLADSDGVVQQITNPSGWDAKHAVSCTLRSQQLVRIQNFLGIVSFLLPFTDVKAVAPRAGAAPGWRDFWIFHVLRQLYEVLSAVRTRYVVGSFVKPSFADEAPELAELQRQNVLTEISALEVALGLLTDQHTFTRAAVIGWFFASSISAPAPTNVSSAINEADDPAPPRAGAGDSKRVNRSGKHGSLARVQSPPEKPQLAGSKRRLEFNGHVESPSKLARGGADAKIRPQQSGEAAAAGSSALAENPSLVPTTAENAKLLPRIVQTLLARVQEWLDLRSLSIGAEYTNKYRKVIERTIALSCSLLREVSQLRTVLPNAVSLIPTVEGAADEMSYDSTTYITMVERCVVMLETYSEDGDVARTWARTLASSLD